jgi:hypothetical protein
VDILVKSEKVRDEAKAKLTKRASAAKRTNQLYPSAILLTHRVIADIDHVDRKLTGTSSFRNIISSGGPARCKRSLGPFGAA